MRRTDSLEKTLMLGKIEGRGKQDIRGWDDWMSSLTRWTWVWVSSGSWTGKPGMLQSMGWQRVIHNWMTELNWWYESVCQDLGIYRQVSALACWLKVHPLGRVGWEQEGRRTNRRICVWWYWQGSPWGVQCILEAMVLWTCGSYKPNKMTPQESAAPQPEVWSSEHLCNYNRISGLQRSPGEFWDLPEEAEVPAWAQRHLSTLSSCVCAKSLQLCLTLCNPMDCSLPGLHCPCDSPSKNTGVGCHFLLQGIFLTQGLNPCLLCVLQLRRVIYH